MKYTVRLTSERNGLEVVTIDAAALIDAYEKAKELYKQHDVKVEDESKVLTYDSLTDTDFEEQKESY